MREPSLHIYRTDLIYLLDKYNGDLNNTEELAKYLLKKGAAYQLSNRKAMVAKIYNRNKKVQYKINTTLDSAKSHSLKILKEYNIQKQIFQKFGFKPVKENSKDFNYIRESTQLMNRFCESFQMPFEEGYRAYIKLGLTLLDKFYPQKLVTAYEFICESHQALLEIRSDPNLDITHELYQKYYEIVTSKTGLSNDYKSQPNKFVYFVRAAVIADRHKISSIDYINAHFKSLEWISGLPDPSQLVGRVSMERIQKYLFSQNKKSTVKLDDFINRARVWQQE